MCTRWAERSSHRATTSAYLRSDSADLQEEKHDGEEEGGGANETGGGQAGQSKRGEDVAARVSNGRDGGEAEAGTAESGNCREW